MVSAVCALIEKKNKYNTTIHHDVTTITDVLPGGKSRSVPMATLVNCMEGDTPPAEA